MIETQELEETVIDWTAFEHGQELDNVRKLYNLGSFNLIPSVIVNMTMEKEKAIQSMVNSQGVNVLHSESAVAREFRQEEAKLGRFPISTPEEEAYWQAKFDAEKAERDGVKVADEVEVAEPQRLSESTTAVKPKCTVCGKEAGNKGLLAAHMKSHDQIAKSQPPANV